MRQLVSNNTMHARECGLLVVIGILSRSFPVRSTRTIRYADLACPSSLVMNNAVYAYSMSALKRFMLTNGSTNHSNSKSDGRGLFSRWRIKLLSP